MPVQPRRISDFKSILTNVAQTSHYQVIFGGLPSRLSSYLITRGVDPRFIVNDVGLLCYSATLPSTQLSTANISGNYMGIQEKFAHSRIYDQITLEFYVDKDYKIIKFLEHWMEFIASGSHNVFDSINEAVSQTRKDYFVRMQYPEYYKSESVKIIKFERDYKREIEYNFVGLFPSAMNSIPVNYQSSGILTAAATFTYDRYIPGKRLSLDVARYTDNNKSESRQTPSPTPTPTYYRTGQSLGNESGVRGVIYPQGSVIPTIVR